MNTPRNTLLALALSTLGAFHADAAVKLTALTINSTDATGNIQGAGGHRFKTTNHGGQPAIFVVASDDLDGAIVNGPALAQNGIDLTVSGGTHTYTVFAEKANSYSWTNYTMQFFFDGQMAPQISALAPLNSTSTQFFPPFTANAEYTENLTGYPVKAPNTLVYKSGQTEVRLVAFHFSAPQMFNKDRVGPFEGTPNQKMDYVGQFTLEVSAPPAISAGGVVNAASFTPKVAPGSLFSIFGSDLAPTAQNALNVPLPTSLVGASVTIGGKPAPLVFVSPDQINAQVPYEVAPNATVPVIVTVNGVQSLVQNVAVVAAAPGIFQFGQKRAVVQNQDYSVNTAENPAEAGSYVVAYLTGFGAPDRAVTTGNVAPSDPLARAAGTVVATLNGSFAEVAFSGLTPGFIGLTQVNMKIPNLAPGTYPLVISLNNEKSNGAMITVK